MHKRKPPKLPESTRYQDEKSPEDFNRSVLADKLSSIKAPGQNPQAGQTRQPSYNRPVMHEFLKQEASRQAGVLAGITNMASKTRYNKPPFDETSPKYNIQNKNAGRDKILQLVMPKLNNFNSGQENMRNLTHLKLDPIEQSFQGSVQQFIN